MIKVLGARVLIEPEEVEEKTKGGIYIPDPVREAERLKMSRGTIKQIGPLCWKHPDLAVFEDGEFIPWCNLDDYVVYANYGGRIVTDKSTGKKYVILNDEDVIAKVEENEDE